MSGKGDAPRPKTVDSGEFARNWDRVFGKRPEVLGSDVWAPRPSDDELPPDAFVIVHQPVKL